MANAIEAATFFSRSFWDAARPFILDVGPEVRVFHVADRCDFDPMLKNVDFFA
jgi:hypothetical protein